LKPKSRRAEKARRDVRKPFTFATVLIQSRMSEATVQHNRACRATSGSGAKSFY
jgi:hypothetical protein